MEIAPVELKPGGQVQSDRELWLAERARLIEKNKMVQTKVEAMITRLKALGQE